MATKIPPHNLSELVGGLVELMDNPECETKDLMKHIKGPDFPTQEKRLELKEFKTHMKQEEERLLCREGHM